MANEWYCVLLDTEFTAWDGSQQRNWSGKNEFKEIIQIGAVKLRINAHSATIEDQFTTLVKPKINPMLSSYIIELTGISQEMLDELGVDLASGVRGFYRFSNDGSLPILSWGSDFQIIKSNCNLIELPLPQFSGGVCNLRNWSRNLALRGNNLSSGQLAEGVGISLSGHEHNALFDVKSIAVALNYWLAHKELDHEMLYQRCHKQ